MAGLAGGFGMKLDLSIQEINLILASLGRMPYESVFGMIEKIQAQAKGQAEAK